MSRKSRRRGGSVLFRDSPDRLGRLPLHREVFPSTVAPRRASECAQAGRVQAAVGDVVGRPSRGARLRVSGKDSGAAGVCFFLTVPTESTGAHHPGRIPQHSCARLGAGMRPGGAVHSEVGDVVRRPIRRRKAASVRKKPQAGRGVLFLDSPTESAGARYPGRYSSAQLRPARRWHAPGRGGYRRRSAMWLGDRAGARGCEWAMWLGTDPGRGRASVRKKPQAGRGVLFPDSPD
ncbi:hypothetical protein J2Z79_002515 [Symbiobacterium terraclitae]|uniref:Uncharacterized protein n=1 Tax=Symbiobacterium terraclitae TaxID=557451 RepID=A0ABS4JU86_9FIRM|nr:hypothetical protein [Symbiobacterium terraclitae]